MVGFSPLLLCKCAFFFSKIPRQTEKKRDETTRCPMCKDLLIPLILHQFVEDGETFEQIWWTCRAAQKDGDCTFPAQITPLDVFWVKRTMAERFLGTIPPPNLHALDPVWRHLYPSIFQPPPPTTPTPTCVNPDGTVVTARRRRRLGPTPSVASSSTFSSCASSSGSRLSTDSSSPRRVLIDDSVYSSSIAFVSLPFTQCCRSSPLRRRNESDGVPSPPSSLCPELVGDTTLSVDNNSRLSMAAAEGVEARKEEVASSSQLNFDPPDILQPPKKRPPPVLKGRGSAETRTARAPDDERIAKEIVAEVRQGNDHLMTNEPIQFFNSVIAKRFVREEFLNELGSTIVRTKLLSKEPKEKEGETSSALETAPIQDLSYEEIRDLIKENSAMNFSELRYDHPAAKRKATELNHPKAKRFLPEVSQLVKTKMEKYKNMEEAKRDREAALEEQLRLRELAEFGEEDRGEEMEEPAPSTAILPPAATEPTPQRQDEEDEDMRAYEQQLQEQLQLEASFRDSSVFGDFEQFGGGFPHFY